MTASDRVTKPSAPSVEEALAALDDAGAYISASAEGRAYPNQLLTGIELARTCLESVAQERRDWLAIEAWLAADEDRYQSSGPQYAGGHYYMLYPNQMRTERHAFYGDSPAECRAKAAAWCRAEMGSKT